MSSEKVTNDNSIIDHWCGGKMIHHARWGGGAYIVSYRSNVYSVESHPFYDDIYCIIKVILDPPLRGKITAYVVIDTNYTDDSAIITHYNADGDESEYNYRETTHFIGYNGGKGDWIHRIEVHNYHHWDLLAEIEIT